MSVFDKIKCKGIASNIKMGKWGEYTGDNFEEIIEKVKQEYELTQEMEDYILTLLNPNEVE